MSPSRPDRDLIELVSELGRAARIFQRGEAFCEGVSFTQFLILDEVDKAEGRLRLSALHGALDVDKSTTTRLVAPLLTRRLLVKRRCAEDGRAFELRMTPEGAVVLAGVWDCIAGAAELLERFLPAAERQQTYQGVRRFLRALRAACTAGCCAPTDEGGCNGTQ